MSVSAVIVTRGNVELEQILDTIPPTWEQVVWANGRGVERTQPPGWTYSRGDMTYVAGDGGAVILDQGELDLGLGRPAFPDLGVYGRYEAISRYATGDWIYVQDDDCLVQTEHQKLLVDMAKAKPAEIVANMPTSRFPDYPDSCLVGWGAAFHRDLPKRAFDRFASAKFEESEIEALRGDWYQRTCDVVFTTLTPHTKVALGFQHLPWAEGPGRMFTEDPERHREERARMLDVARRVRDA